MAFGLSPSVTRMIANLHAWDRQPQHRTGTSGDLATSHSMAQAIEESGAEAEIQAFPFIRRIPRNCSVEINGHTIDGVPLFDCNATPDDGIVAPIQTLGKSGGVGLGGFSSSNGRGETRDLLSHRKSKFHVGLIAVSSFESPGIALLNADSFVAPFGVPVLQVESSNEPVLREAAETNAECRLTVTFGYEQTDATNVLTKISGRDNTLAPIVVITPKSSWWTCTAERGGGLAIWHECIHELAANRDEVKRDVLFAATTGHELGHVGLKHYIGQNPDLVIGAHAWVHLGANFIAVDSKKRMQVSDKELLEFGLDRLKKAGISMAGITPPGVRPGGEARDVFDGGGRYISFLGSNRWFHHPIDRLEFNINLDSLVMMRRAVVEIVRDLCVA